MQIEEIGEILRQILKTSVSLRAILSLLFLSFKIKFVEQFFLDSKMRDLLIFLVYIMF